MKAILFCKYNTALSLVSPNLCASLMLIMQCSRNSRNGVEEIEFTEETVTDFESRISK